jgi:hypothetical protein
MDWLADHMIDDLESYRAVPGDTIRVVQQLGIHLEGHNLLAELGITDADGNEFGDKRLDPDGDHPGYSYASRGTEEFRIEGARLVTAGAPEDAALWDAQPWELTNLHDPVTGEVSHAYRFTENDTRDMYAGDAFWAVYDVVIDVDDQLDAIHDPDHPDLHGHPEMDPNEVPDPAAMVRPLEITGLNATLTQVRHVD